MKRSLFFLGIIFSLFSNACKENKHNSSKTNKCNFDEVQQFSKSATNLQDSLLLQELLCTWNTVSVDSPCCNRENILMEIDKNYNTTLLQTYACGNEVDLFADNMRDLLYFHKIIELQFTDSSAYQLNKLKLSAIDDSKPAFKTINKGTLAWRLKPIFVKNSIFLIFSNTKSKYTTQIAGILDSIVLKNKF